MTKIKSIIQDYKTPPVAVRPATVKPARVSRVQSRAEIKKTMATAPRPHQQA